MSLTLDQVNAIPPMTDAELEAAKKKDAKLRNMAESFADLGIKLEVIPLRSGMPAAQ